MSDPPGDSRLSAALDDAPVVGAWSTTTRRVVAITVLALLARVVFLDGRVAHFDEARVGYWTLSFLDTGAFHYESRYIIHGPLVQHVNRAVFAAVGANDFTLRLFVAAFGGLLPLSALLFRDRLDGLETVTVAGFLAANPVLLYYSRFFRSTILVAGFSLITVGCLVRLLDHRRSRALYGAALALACAFAAKENAVIYVLCWVGATALLVDTELFRPGGDHSGADRLRSLYDRGADWLTDDAGAVHVPPGTPRHAGHVGAAIGLFLALSLFFYAPRTPNTGAVGLWTAVGDPTKLPSLVAATQNDLAVGYGYWFGQAGESGASQTPLVEQYATFLVRFLETLVGYARALTFLAIAGFLLERYARDRSRPLVMFAGYWGFVSVLGYPLGTDIWGAWVTVNALVPLAIPAGVGLAVLLRWTGETLARDPVAFGAGAFLLVLVAGSMGAGIVGGVYLNDQSADNGLVQFAQPADDVREQLAVLDNAETHEDVDVLFVGPRYLDERAGGIEPRCTRIQNTLPLEWYLALEDATGDCAEGVDDLDRPLSETRPLVIVAVPDQRDAVAQRVDGYDVGVYRLRTFGSRAVVFSDRTGNTTAG